jgi:hypothetical protein
MQNVFEVSHLELLTVFQPESNTPASVGSAKRNRRGTLADYLQLVNSLYVQMRPIVNGPALLQSVDSLVALQASRDARLAVGALAGRCIALTGDERPTMAEVVFELQRIVVLQGEGPGCEGGGSSRASSFKGGVLGHSVLDAR